MTVETPAERRMRLRARRIVDGRRKETMCSRNRCSMHGNVVSCVSGATDEIAAALVECVDVETSMSTVREIRIRYEAGHIVHEGRANPVGPRVFCTCACLCTLSRSDEAVRPLRLAHERSPLVPPAGCRRGRSSRGEGTPSHHTRKGERTAHVQREKRSRRRH
jgi:hypothetical protein